MPGPADVAVILPNEIFNDRDVNIIINFSFFRSIILLSILIKLYAMWIINVGVYVSLDMIIESIRIWTENNKTKEQDGK